MLNHLLATMALALAVALPGAGTARAQHADEPAVAPGAPERRDLRQQAAGASSPVPPQRPGEAAEFAGRQAAGQIRFREIHRAGVVDRRGEGVGRVEGVILDDAGHIVGAVVAVGGFLGVAEKSIAVAWRELRPARGAPPAEPLTLTLIDLTGEQLRQAPEYRTPQQARADQVVEASRQRMLDKQERGVLQRALQALDRADRALQLQDQEAARAALTQARQAVEQAIEAAAQQQQPTTEPEPPAAARARQP